MNKYRYQLTNKELNNLKSVLYNGTLKQLINLSNKVGLKISEYINYSNNLTDYGLYIETEDNYSLLEYRETTGIAGLYKFDGSLVNSEDRI